jgi:hypothetical protein
MTRHPELCVVQQEEEAGGRVVKLTPVVALDSFDSPTKLSRHIEKKWNKVVKVSDLSFREKSINNE